MIKVFAKKKPKGKKKEEIANVSSRLAFKQANAIEKTFQCL